MKNISKFLNESLYDSLDLGKTQLIDDWIEIYNSQKQYNSKFGTHRYDAYREGQKVLIPGTIIIEDDRLVENGLLPNYINIDAVYEHRDHTINGLNIIILNDSLKSFKGKINYAKNESFYVVITKSRSFEDWSDINSISAGGEIYIPDPDQCKINFKGLKPIGPCILHVENLSSSNVKLLDSISGATFSIVQFAGDLRGHEEGLRGFFKKNIIKSPGGQDGESIISLFELALSNFEFISSTNPKTHALCSITADDIVPASWKTDPVVAKKIFDVFRLKQFEKISINHETTPTGKVLQKYRKMGGILPENTPV